MISVCLLTYFDEKWGKSENEKPGMNYLPTDLVCVQSISVKLAVGRDGRGRKPLRKRNLRHVDPSSLLILCVLVSEIYASLHPLHFFAILIRPPPSALCSPKYRDPVGATSVVHYCSPNEIAVADKVQVYIHTRLECKTLNQEKNDPSMNSI